MATLNLESLFGVKGLVAVITGGGTGIGAMMAKALAVNGADKVYIIGRRIEPLQEVAQSSPLKNIIPLQGDVTSKESLSAIADAITKEVGYINVLIANSGVAGPQCTSINKDTSIEDFRKSMWGMDIDDYTNTFRINCSAVWFSAMAFLLLLDKGNKTTNVEQKSQIIATSSIAAFNRKAPGGYAYGQSKAATISLVKQLATNLVPYGIRANAIAPGLYPSEMSKDLIGDGQFSKDIIPAERVGTPEDMAGCVLYLTSRAGSYCNGVVVVTDGGRLSMMPATY